MSIVRVGLAETNKFAEGYEAIFGKKKPVEDKGTEAAAKSGKSKKKKGSRKK